MLVAVCSLAEATTQTGRAGVQEGANDDPAVTLDIGSLFDRGEWDGERLPDPRWLDGRHYATLEPSASVAGALDLVRWSPDGTGRPLVTAEELGGAVRREPLVIQDYRLAPDGRSLLLFTGAQRVWRASTRGDAWSFDLASRRLTRLGAGARAGVTMFAEFAPDSQRVAFVRDHELYVHDLRTGVETRLTTDGSDRVMNGSFDWSYEEVLGLSAGFRWSPDGRQIAYWQIDTTLVPELAMIGGSPAGYPEVRRVPYARAGEILPAARIGVVPSGGGATRWVRFPDSPRDHYLTRMAWVPAGDQLVVQRLDRAQRTHRVFRIDVRRSELEPRAVLVERDSAWVEVHDGLRWLDGGRAFTWLSERDGWRRLYRASLDDGTATPLTPPGVDVLSVEHVDPAGSVVYYTAAPAAAAGRGLYRVAADADGAPPVRTTTADEGFHQYRVSPDGSLAIHVVSRFATPPRMELVELPTHRALRTLVSNDALRARVDRLGLPHEMLRIAIDASDSRPTALDGWLMPPVERQAGRRYPLLVHVEGEPGARAVVDRWSGRQRLWHRLLNGAGYAVAGFDHRGSAAPRGRTWRRAVQGELGTLAAADQAAAVEALAAVRGWIDRERVGISGSGAGGTITLHALFRQPRIFALGMAVAPIADPRNHAAVHIERLMGAPRDDPSGYARASPLRWVDGLRGQLLLVTESGDGSVHAQGTAALIDALVAAGKPFAMMTYPTRPQGDLEGAASERHLYELLTTYLFENLPPGPS